MKKVLVANRGEIAVRIIRACHDLGLQTVAIYSEADREALHVLHADEAVCIGDAPSAKSYLHIPSILSACEITGADAIHPGYGFLSENSSFRAICDSCGIKFVGPSQEAIALLGDKAQAKKTAQRANCPVISGSNGIVQTLEEAVLESERIGFPLLIKAVAGGGGKGIRVCDSIESFKKQFIAAQSEAEVNFGRSDVYLEKMIANPRHVEVQILADEHGNCVYIGERDCTIQRRRQKLIEEAPSPVLSDASRQEIGEAAVRIAKLAGYSSAGTVEFLLDSAGNFYFMEVNTRIQVEHTVTEELSGIDLVEMQLRIAQGEQLPFSQEEMLLDGHVMQFRINAEDPEHHFMPSPGKLEYYLPPGGPHVRVDSACYSGYVIPPFYDSMVAKLIVKGKDRAQAIQRAKRALREFHIGGIKSTIPFHLHMLDDPNFLDGSYDLAYVDLMLEKGEVFSFE